MAFNNKGPVANMPPARPGQAGSPPGWKELRDQRAAELLDKTKGRKRLFTILSIIFLIMLVFAGLRVSALLSGTDDQLVVHIANQQPATVDLRQSFPISPDLFGTNVFPKTGSSSLNKANNGFMDYSTPIYTGIHDMHMRFLRFPGGTWGSQNILSLNQLDDFSNLLTQTGADGMIQAYIGGPLHNADVAGGPLVPNDMDATLDTRARNAGNWVDYMNNRGSDLRRDRPTSPFHPVTLWAVGNEPDLNAINDPLTNKPFDVNGYTQAFIQYSIKMHQSNPTISVFGPEISRFDGIGVGPRDATNALWMEGFLQGIAQYEKDHYSDNPGDNTKIHYHILDGVSFHFYPFGATTPPSEQLLSNADSWSYLLAPLRNQIRADFGRDMPVAITEINTNPSGKFQPTPGQAALWWADTLGTLMNQQVDYVGFFATQGVTTPYPLFLNGHQTAMAQVTQVFSHIQSKLVPLSVQHDPISVYATVDDKRQTVSLLFVNKSPDSQVAQINPTATALSATGPWHSQNIVVGGNSVVLVTLYRGSNAEAYSFTVPTTNDANNATVGPINHVTCGQSASTDAATPC